MDINLEEIQIGDYADITIDNITYRYYVVKIQPISIIVAEMNNPKKTHILIKKGDNYQINDNIATFNKNTSIETQYLERDFTAVPIRINIIIRKSDIYENFSELKNGIILSGFEESGKNGIYLRFSDPNNVKMKSSHYIEEYKVNLEKATIFYKMKISEKKGTNYDILNYDNENSNEIFIINHGSNTIDKLNLKDLTITGYDKITQYGWIHGLKNKKILYSLKNRDNIYILDLTTKKRIVIDAKLAKAISFNKIYQLANEDIILQISHSGIDEANDEEFYHININDGSFVKSPKSPDYWIIAMISNDGNFLLWNLKTEMLQIWDYLNDHFIDIVSNIEPFDAYITSLVLHNGDVLFHIAADIYLFSYNYRTVINLPLLSNKYTRDAGDTVEDCHFKQLRNGNLIFNNGRHLSIIEFPINQGYYDRLNYDQMNPAINSIAPDMLKLIRDYL